MASKMAAKIAAQIQEITIYLHNKSHLSEDNVYNQEKTLYFGGKRTTNFTLSKYSGNQSLI